MKSTRILTAMLCASALISLGACKTEVKTGSGTDTTATGTSYDTTTTGSTTTGSTTTGSTMDTTSTMGSSNDTSHTTVGGAVSNAGQEVKDESIEKMVEAALIAKRGFEDVTVESAPDGVIILNGTVKSDAEKADAQATAAKTAGVKKVTNNLTIKK
jgi:hyperosmotically inducible protein